MADEERALLEEVHAPWEFASRLEAGSTDLRTTVPALLASQGDAVVTTLQTSGVSKLGEFHARSNAVYPAFNGEPILTCGSSQRDIDFEAVWRKHLRNALHKGEKPTGWSNSVVVEAFVVNVIGAANPDKDGLIQPLLKRWQLKALDITAFGLPAVQAVVEFKWRTFAKRLLLGQLAIYCCWILSFFAFAILFQDEDPAASLADLLATGRGQATVAAELASLAAMTPFMMLEVGTISAYRLGWVSIWNVTDICTYALQATIAVLHLQRKVDSGYLSIACALQCIMLLFRLQYFSRVFTATRFAFLEAVKEAIKAISAYLAFMLLIMLGFAVSFHVLFRADQQHAEFRTITDSFLLMYANQGGLLDLDLMRDSHNPVAATLLAVVYAFVMGMVILNMLVGVMSNALEKTGEHSALKLLLNKASIIDELEAAMPRWLEARFVDRWYPDYIHILRIDPDRVDKPDLSSMWTQQEDAASGGQGDSAGLAVQLAEVRAQLARMEALLQQALAQGAAATPASSGTC